MGFPPPPPLQHSDMNKQSHNGCFCFNLIDFFEDQAGQVKDMRSNGIKDESRCDYFDMQHQHPAGSLLKAQGHYCSAGGEGARTEQVSLKLNLDPENRTRNAVRTTNPP